MRDTGAESMSEKEKKKAEEEEEEEKGSYEWSGCPGGTTGGLLTRGVARPALRKRPSLRQARIVEDIRSILQDEGNAVRDKL